MEISQKRKPDICMLSNELLCHILSFLPLKEVLRMSMMNRKLNAAVEMHLMLCKELDFCQDSISSYMPTGIKDKNLMALLKKCPNVETVRGLHPQKVDRWRLRKLSSLSIPGIIEALYLCSSLKRIETNNLKLLESISQYLPQVEIIGVFRNRDGVFPPQSNQQLKLSPFLRITSLHLIGVQVPELTVMPELEYLYLQWVSFTKLHPFRAFSATKLKTFVMRHCVGPALPLRYYSLFIALGLASDLSRLELVRVPLLGGMINRTVEDVLRERGFQRLRKIVIGDCKGIIESDVGQLIIAASPSLESLTIQASLTKDSLFVSLHFARCDFSRMHTLHLGYIDDFPSKEEWSNDALLRTGLVDVPDVPSSITDTGMKFVSQLFPNVKNLTISNCPHVTDPMRWIPEGRGMWEDLKFLTLERCHCLRLAKFSRFLRVLKNVEVVVLKNMFREPPKGCSHVGLSAGTGLGLSSAVVSTQDEHIAVQGHQIEAVQENENDEDEGHASSDENNNLMIGAENRNEEDPEPWLPAGQMRRRRRRRPSSHADQEAADDNQEQEEIPERHTRSSSKRNISNSSGRAQRLRSTRSSSSAGRCNADDPSQPSCSNSGQCSRGVQSGGFDESTVSSKRRRISSRRSPTSRSKSSRVQKHHRTTNRQVDSSSETDSNAETSARPSTSKGKRASCTSSQRVSPRDKGVYRGPMTRRRKKMMSVKTRCSRSRHSCTQSTQTVRRCTPQSLSYRASSSSPSSAATAASTSRCNKLPSRARRPSSGKETEKTKKPKKCDKSTSTSDPLLEDDVTEVFSVVSERLRSLTVISCGISHIVLKHAPNMLHLEAQSCRILKCVCIPDAPLLHRLNISQCPKLNMPKLLTEVLKVDRVNPILVYINPYYKSYMHTVPEIERLILTEAGRNQCVAIMHDFCSSESDRGPCRESLLKLLLTLKSLYGSVCEDTLTLSDDENEEQDSDVQYPWGHRLERVFGSSRNSTYELLVNSSLLAVLWKEYYNHSKGTLQMSEHLSENVFDLPHFSLSFAESVESEEPEFKQFFGFYIHMSENQDFG